jgi:LPS export ABC transporter protein LptC/lipopolysaccharide transport protein LptA
MIKRIVFTAWICFLGAAPVFAQEGAQKFQGFNLQGFTAGGEKAWDVKGDTANINGNTIELTNVDGNRYGDQVMNLTAQKGIVDKVSGDIHLEKDVVITSERGSQLKTDTLDWHKEKDLVTTNDRVVLTDENMKATGTGLTASPGLKIAQMNKDVTVNVNAEPKKVDGQRVTITCDGPLEIDQKNSKATFNENVVAVQTDRSLKADKMEVYFDANTQKIKQLICIGHVLIQMGENSSYSDRAVYDALAETMVLTGRPKLIMITENKGGLSSFGKKEKEDTAGEASPKDSKK